MIRIISATRLSPSEFLQHSPLGISLGRLAYDRRIKAIIAFENKVALPIVFNEGMDTASDQDIVVFMHDDVWIDDFFLAERLVAGLTQADILGVAGSKCRIPRQPGWAFSGIKDGKLVKVSSESASGSIGHGQQPFGAVSFYGEVPAACELMDGVFLAARKSVLRANDIRFDKRFDFHFYDMDFCRQCRAKGLQLSTWPVCLTHQSGGAFGTSLWSENYRRYLEKWRD